MVDPRNATNRLPPPGISPRWRSKSPRPRRFAVRELLGQSGRRRSPARSGRRRTARTCAGFRWSRNASSNIRVFSDVPLPSSTSVSAPLSCRDHGGTLVEDRRLGTSRVVLRQPGDPVEQLAADGVVEVLGRQRLRGTRSDRRGRRRAVARPACRPSRWSSIGDGHRCSSRAVSVDPAGVHLDEVAVGDVDPSRVVVVGLAGHHDTVGRDEVAQRVAPGGGQQAGTVGRQQVQAGIRGRRRPTAVTTATTGRGPRRRRWAASTAESQTDSASRCGGQHLAVDAAVVREQPAPSVNGAAALSSIGMPTVADRTAASTHPTGQRRGDRREGRRRPTAAARERQRTGSGGRRRRSRRPSRRRSSGRVFLAARCLGLHEQPVRGLQHQRGHAAAARPARPGAYTSLPREPQAGEDLPADRQVPVAEARAQDVRRHRPRAAAQHPVVAAEERLAVVGVEHRGEAGPRLESARWSTPTRRRPSARRRTPRRRPRRRRPAPVAGRRRRGWRARRRGCVAPGPASPCVARPGPRRRPSPTPARWAAARPPTWRRPRPRRSRRAAPVRRRARSPRRGRTGAGSRHADQNSGAVEARLQTVLPAALRPPLRLVVAAGVDERAATRRW